MHKQQEKFGLFTTVSMISGIVIGSGIFFKTDDILQATGGSVRLGVLLWILAGFGIVFGGLTVSIYAKKESKAGGLITYSEMAWGNKWGYISGWFQTTFYYPAIVAILSFVASIYLGLLFGINDPTHPLIWIFTLGIMIFLFLFNVVSTRLAGGFQNLTLAIKISALAILSLTGLLRGNGANISATTFTTSSTGIFHGLIACAFSFDGWFIAPSIAHEIKNPKKNLSRALVLAPLMILGVYLLYFVGINAILGPKTIIELGDASVGFIVSDLLGPIGVNLVYSLVFISIIGAVNGLILAYIRLPYALAIREEFYKHEYIQNVHPKFDVSLTSSFIAFLFSLLWLGLHFLSVFDFNVLFFKFSALEIDSLPIVLMYLFYIALFLRVMIDYIQHQEHGIWYGMIFPSLATWGSLLIVVGGFIDPNSLIYFVISLVGIGLGLWLRPKKTEKKEAI